MNHNHVNNAIHRRTFQVEKVAGKHGDIKPHVYKGFAGGEEEALVKRQSGRNPLFGDLDDPATTTTPVGGAPGGNRTPPAQTTTSSPPGPPVPPPTTNANTNTNTRTTQTTSTQTPPTTTRETTPATSPPVNTTTSTTPTARERETTQTTPTTTSTTSIVRTTSSTPTTSSTTPTTVTTSSTSSTPPAVNTTPPRANTPPKTVTNSLLPSNSITGSAANATETPQHSGATGTGAIVGGVMGGIVGVAILCFVVAFVIRRLRKRRNEEDHFDAAQFRRSAAMLDDEFISDNRLQRGNSIGSNRAGYGATGGGGYPGSDRPRPPTMIERHMANTPASAGAPPPMPAFNYNQQYGYDGQGYNSPGYAYDQGYPGAYQPGDMMSPVTSGAPESAYMGGMPSPALPVTYGYAGAAAELVRSRSMSSSGHGHGGYNDLQRNPSMNAGAGYADLHRNPSAASGYGGGYAVGEYVAPPPVPVMSPPPPAASPETLGTTQASAMASVAAAARAGAPASNAAPATTTAAERRPSKDGKLDAPAAPAKRPDTVYDEGDAYGGM